MEVEGVCLGSSELHDKENIVVCSQSISEQKNAEIVRQCEFYFSDANILKDQFLLKLVKSSKEGWVDLVIIANFKKMQALSTDHDVIRKALTASAKLEISEDGMTIRRRDPLPVWDKSVYGRSVILSDFPMNSNVTVESITEFFTNNGQPPASFSLGIHICISFNSRSKKLIETTDNKASKLVTSEGTDTTRKPLFRGLSNHVHVVHVREPFGPPTEDSAGFPPGWRDLLRFQRLLLRDSTETNVSANAQFLAMNSTILCVDSGQVCAS
ncbi:unnamed protein product [Heterobilharzia americana]|nr:unnamed protein product [Heterobilharzia americana]